MRAHRLAAVLAAAVMISTLTPGRAFAQGNRGDLGSISVKTVPADAQVYIDGERWVGPDTDGRLVVQLPAGRHMVEVRAQGYRSYVAEVDVRAGETTPVNVSLAGAEARGGQPPMAGPPPHAGTGITQVTSEGEETGFSFSPDYRVAEVNHHAESLVGGYAGLVLAGHLFLGGGGYGQVSGNRNDVSLAYGGAVVEWREWTDRPVGVTLHALVGGGDARLRQDVIFFMDGHHSPFDGRHFFDFHTGFAVFEPELQVNVRLAHGVRVAFGGGYRVTSTERGVSNDLLNGWSGTISFRFGK